MESEKLNVNHKALEALAENSYFPIRGLVITIMPMTATHLDLLTRDGSLSVTFAPDLDEEYYAELFDIATNAETASELKVAVIEAAHRWGRKVAID